MDERARSGVAKRSEAPSLSEEARVFGRDEHEAQLWEQFFSWPPPAPRAADLTFEPFEQPPLPRGTRRAIWASSLMLVLSIGGIGGYFAYHNYVMPPPAALGDWSDTDTVPLPTPILADDVAQRDPEPRRVYQASLQHDVSAIKQTEPVASDEARGAGEAQPAAEAAVAAPASGTAEPSAQAQGEAPAATPALAAPAAHGPGDVGAAAPSGSDARAQGEAAPSPPAAAEPGASESKPGEARAAEASGQVQAEVKPVPAADAAVSFYEQLAVAQQQLAQGELRQSLPTFERALSLRAHSVDALLGKATALFGLKEYEAAKSSAQLALAIDPRSNEAFALIGGSLEWLGRRAEAKAIYERCIEEAVDATVCRERQAHLTASE